jgi:hypothetical protein
LPQKNPHLLEGVDLLIVGGPINWWRPSKRMRAFLSRLEKKELNGIKAASFDTRMGSWVPGNDAMKKIARELKRAGAEIICPSQFFKVERKKGPLRADEIEKAKIWARSIIEKE